MRVLYVDTYNTCNSASAAAVLSAAAHGMGLPGIMALSAGTKVSRGSRACPYAPALRGVRHVPRELSDELVDGADLIIVPARSDLQAIAKHWNPTPGRTFTVRQVGRWSAWMQENQIVAAARARALDPDHWRQQFPSKAVKLVEPYPVDPRQALDWTISELNAARGVMPFGYARRKPSLRHNKKLGPLRKAIPKRTFKPPAGPHPDDLADPHGDDGASHELAYQQIVESTQSLVQFLGTAGVGRWR